ncbi:30S ribosomal protein S6 [bacterium]|nr:30S ribosomal protein S6 [bacterium]
MKTYELLAIFKPNLDVEEVDNAVAKIGEDVVEFGGKVESTEKIGRKKLAFDVQNYRDGFFTTIVLALPADKVAEFKRQLRLNDNVLRTMFLEVSKKASV